MKKLKKKMEKLMQFNEKLKKSWKYSIVGKFIYSVCLNCGETKSLIYVITEDFKSIFKGIEPSWILSP